MSVWSDSVAMFRTAFADAFEDECTIVRTTARGTFNPATNRFGTPSTSLIYSGACLIRPAGLTADVRARADADISVGRYELRIPHDTDGIQPDDIVTCTTSGFDADLQGQTFVVIDISQDTFNTHRLVSMELVRPRGQP